MRAWKGTEGRKCRLVDKRAAYNECYSSTTPSINTGVTRDSVSESLYSLLAEKNVRGRINAEGWIPSWAVFCFILIIRIWSYAVRRQSLPILHYTIYNISPIPIIQNQHPKYFLQIEEIRYINIEQVRSTVMNRLCKKSKICISLLTPLCTLINYILHAYFMKTHFCTK